VTSIKLGLRNLFRNRWRSALTLGAVAVAVGLMIWSLALYEGWIREMVRGATSVQTAQVQVHTAAYVDHPRVYYSFPADSALYREIQAVPRVVALAPRIKLTGLVGNEQRSQVAQILGIDPVREAQTTPIADAVVQGRWLSNDPAPYPAPREAVIGAGMARQLEAEPGDSLVTFLEAADGSLGNDLLQVVGIIQTSNTQVDQMAVYLHLADAQFLGALDGQIHEIAIRTNDLTLAGETATAVAQAIGGIRSERTPGGEATSSAASEDELLVQPWQEILPGVDQMIVIFRRSYWVLYVLVYILAAAGVLNTQRMSALERRREFGVMMAIGMRPRRMLRTLLVETAVLGIVGAGVGCALGTALSWYHSVYGFDMGLLADQATFSYMGVAFSQRLYFVLHPAIVVQPVVIMVVVAVFSGLWPAYRAARIDPAPTIAGRT
jgi:ABC-type lipoprotein release transport system permease subunit